MHGFRIEETWDAVPRKAPTATNELRHAWLRHGARHAELAAIRLDAATSDALRRSIGRALVNTLLATGNDEIVIAEALACACTVNGGDREAILDAADAAVQRVRRWQADEWKCFERGLTLLSP